MRFFFERESFKFFVRRDDRSFGDDGENECFELLETECRSPNSCSERCKEQLCHYVVRRFVEWLASICLSNTPGRFVVANFTSFRLTKSILLEMAVYNMQFKLVRGVFESTSDLRFYHGGLLVKMALCRKDRSFRILRPILSTQFVALFG